MNTGKRATITMVAFLILALVLPACAPGGGRQATPWSSPTPAPGRFVRIVDGWECSHDSIGNMIFTGEVRNSGEIALRFVQLRATVFGQSGSDVVNTDSGYIDSDVLEPGASSTFSIYVDDPQDQGKRCDLKVESATEVGD